MAGARTPVGHIVNIPSFLAFFTFTQPSLPLSVLYLLHLSPLAAISSSRLSNIAHNSGKGIDLEMMKEESFYLCMPRARKILEIKKIN